MTELVGAVDDGAVVITGICGRLGRRLARVLHRSGRVIGLDRRAFPDRPPDIEHHEIDLRSKRTKDIFRHGEVRAFVHLGVMHNPRDSAEEHHSWNVVAFQQLLEYAELYNVPKVVLLSSANVYGPRPDNPVFLNEEAPLLGAGPFSEIRDLVGLDQCAQSYLWRYPQTDAVILRPSHILGTVRNAPSNYLRLKVVPTLLGFDPMMQVIHQDDIVWVLCAALRAGVRGIFNVGGPAPVPLSRALELLKRTVVSVPHSVARRALDSLFRFRVTSFPAPELDFIRYVCMVDDSRVRAALGYRPAHDLLETLRAVDEERWQ